MMRCFHAPVGYPTYLLPWDGMTPSFVENASETENARFEVELEALSGRWRKIWTCYWSLHNTRAPVLRPVRSTDPQRS